MAHSESAPFVDDFIAQLEAMPWFSKLGDPTPTDSKLERIYRWDEWPGPEEPSILELSNRHQALYDSIMKDAGAQRGDLSALWDRVHAAVFHAASPKVPYDPREDAWHGPTTAVWQAAWTAGLIALCMKTGQRIPSDLQEQWAWFVRGHWPSGYARLDTNDEPGPLLLY